jgi:hypothetical protein
VTVSWLQSTSEDKMAKKTLKKAKKMEATKSLRLQTPRS